MQAYLSISISFSPSTQPSCLPCSSCNSIWTSHLTFSVTCLYPWVSMFSVGPAGWPLSLVSGRQPLNFWNFLKYECPWYSWWVSLDHTCFYGNEVTLGGPLVYVNEVTSLTVFEKSWPPNNLCWKINCASQSWPKTVDQLVQTELKKIDCQQVWNRVN